MGAKNAFLGEMIRQLIPGSPQARAQGGHLRPGTKRLPESAVFLVRKGIDSISLNSDSVITAKCRVAEVEQEKSEGKTGKER